MPLRYDTAPNLGPLRQGEILGDIWEHRPLVPPTEIPEGSSVPVNSIDHPLMIVMSADCDLEQDYRKRFPDGEVEETYESPVDVEDDPIFIPHVLLCDVYAQGQIRSNIQGSDIWKRIRQNQDGRYHHFDSAPIGDPKIAKLPDLFLDFKKTLALPTKSLYEGLRTRGIKRVAIVPPIYVHDLIQRFYAFHSRIGLPD